MNDPGSVLGRIFKKNWLTRGAWGIIVSLWVIWLLAFGYANLWQVLGYCGANFAIGAKLCKLTMPDFVIEPAVGAGIGLIVYLV